MVTDTQIKTLIINKMSQERYDAMKQAGELNENELYITTDSTSIEDIIPDQTDNAGKFLTTDGSSTAWASLPDTYTKEEIDARISSVYRFRGNVANVDSLPMVDLIIGDVYNVEDTGDNYAWTGEGWDKLSGTIDLTSYYTKTEVDNIVENIDALPEQTNNAGKTLVTNGMEASWQYSSVMNDITNSIETGLSQLVINKLTIDEYNALAEAGQINSNELYITEDAPVYAATFRDWDEE